MLTISLLQKSLRKATLYVNRTQQQDGSFPSESKNDTSHTRKLQTTVFFNAEILYQLNQVDGVGSLHLTRKRLSNFVLTQRAHDGSFNYWCRTPEKQRLPNDIDDSACALLALVESLPANQSVRLASAFINLVKAQYNRGKIYTWFAGGVFKEDYDIVVQLNVKAALLSLGVNFPIYNPKQYLLNNWQTKSKYYVDKFFSSYLANRSETIFDKTALIAEVAQPTSSWKLAISLIVLKQKPTFQQIDFLLHSQHSDGSWLGDDVILEGYTNEERQTYASSKVLATVFIMNILQRYIIDGENTKLAKLLLSVNRMVLPIPGSLDYYLVTTPLLVIRNSITSLKYSDYTKLVSASLSGLYGLRWLNAFVDNKRIDINPWVSAESLMRYIEYFLANNTPKQFKKFLASSLYHQFVPPDKSSYLLKYQNSYEKRVKIGYALSETIPKSFGVQISKQFEKILELTLIIRSISDDILDLESDINNNIATGATALASDYGIKGAVQISYARIIKLTEKVYMLFSANPEVAPYEYRTLQILKHSYKNAKTQYLSEKVARLLRLS